MKRVALKLLRRSPLAKPAAELAKALRSPRAYANERKSRRVWRQQMAFARALPKPAQDAPHLLILSMNDDTYAAKIESMQAIAFRARGWKVVIVTSRLYSNATRLFELAGLTDFAYFEDILNAGTDEDAVEAEIAEKQADSGSFQQVLNWRYREAWVGTQVLSSVSRGAHDGAPDPADPATREALLSALRKSIEFVHGAERFFEREKIDLILVNEPNYHTNGAIVDVAIARDIPVVHYAQPSRDDALVLKKLNRETRRIHPNSLTPGTLESLLAEGWDDEKERRLEEEFGSRYSGRWVMQARNQPDTVSTSRDDIVTQLDLDPAKPIVVVFSHVLWDANLFYGKDLFDNYGEWFAETVKAACRNSDVNWLIKIHPANIWKRELGGVSGEYAEEKLIRTEIGELPAHVRLLPADTKISSFSLFQSIDAGVTVRGSTGFELPCFGVPVITAGTGRYSGLGFTHDSDTREQYLERLSAIADMPRLSDDEVMLAKVHAYGLFVRRPWVFDSFKSLFLGRAVSAMERDIEPLITSKDELEVAPDLRRYFDWASGGELDYLETN